MQFGLDIANMGATADPRRVVELAQAAEEAGWQGLFLWDTLGYMWGLESGEPWVSLAAVAQATTTLRVGTAITPLARYRPQTMAHTLATLDLLSNGRTVFGAGLGASPNEFAAFGEPSAPKERAAMLDEALEVVARLLEGERVTHHGQHYTVNDVQFVSRGVQQPRVPIWIGAEKGNALRRAARWDGWIIYTVGENGTLHNTPDDVGQMLDKIRQYRLESGKSMEGYEVVVTGRSDAGGSVAEYTELGATWWLETLHGMSVPYDELLARVMAGPPRA